jgi:hypothetical protein
LNTTDDKAEPSYLSVGGRNSRLDLIAVSEAAAEGLKSSKTEVISWNLLLENRNSPQFIKEIVEKISDHLPVVTRFYFSDESED